jgi:hypothetical protein
MEFRNEPVINFIVAFRYILDFRTLTGTWSRTSLRLAFRQVLDQNTHEQANLRPDPRPGFRRARLMEFRPRSHCKPNVSRIRIN